MRFRLHTLLWLFAIFASSITVFGGIIGGALACGIWLLWACWFRAKHLTLVEGLTAIALIGLGLAVGLPLQRGGPHHGVNLHVCEVSLHDVAHSVLDFRRSDGTLPQDFETSSGRRLSWRVRVTPYLGTERISQKYGLDEEWDADNERQLLAESLDWFDCVTSLRNHSQKGTRYYAVRGAGTYWDTSVHNSDHIAPSQFRNSIMLIESNIPTVNWHEAGDLSFEEAVGLLTSAANWNKGEGHYYDRGYFWKPIALRGVALGDGTVMHLNTPIPEEMARSLLLVAEGGDDVLRQLEPYSRSPFHYGNIFALCFFLLIVVLPGIVAFWTK